MASFIIPTDQWESFQKQLDDKYQIEAPTIWWNNRTPPRISVNAYNTRLDLEHLADSLGLCGPHKLARSTVAYLRVVFQDELAQTDKGALGVATCVASFSALRIARSRDRGTRPNVRQITTHRIAPKKEGQHRFRKRRRVIMPHAMSRRGRQPTPSTSQQRVFLGSEIRNRYAPPLMSMLMVG